MRHDLPQPTEDALTREAAKMRGDMGEREWIMHLARMARTQARILNRLIELQGPDRSVVEVRFTCPNPNGGAYHKADPDDILAELTNATDEMFGSPRLTG